MKEERKRESLYWQFKSSKMLLEQTKFVRVYSCRHREKTYKIVVTKRIANKHTVLKCEGNHIVWDQIPALFNWNGKMHGEYRPVYQAGQDKEYVVLFVVRGKPNGIVGLDDGVFRSKMGESGVTVLSYKGFRKL